MKNNLNSVIIEGIMANRRRAGYKDAVAFEVAVFGVNTDKTTRVDVITCEAFNHWAGVVAGLDAEAVRVVGRIKADWSGKVFGVVVEHIEGIPKERVL